MDSVGPEAFVPWRFVNDALFARGIAFAEPPCAPRSGLVARKAALPSGEKRMSKVPDEIVVAKLSIEAARIALESLFEKMNALPRSQKMIVTDTVHDACQRLQAAQDLLKELELSDSEPPPPSGA